MFAKLYVTLLCVNGIICSKNENYELLDKTIKALNRSFDFILQDYKSMNVDGLWGVNAAQAHLTRALENVIDSNILRENLLLLTDKAETIYILQGPNLETFPWTLYIFNNYVIPPEIWLHDIEFSYGRLNQNPKVFTGPYNVSNLLEYIDYVLNNPITTSHYSDDCVVEVVTASYDRNPHHCPVNKRCYDYMIKMPKNYDPHLPGTIYLQIAKGRNCTFNKKQVDALLNQECSYILWELKKNVKFGYIPSLFYLFLEQSFCEKVLMAIYKNMNSLIVAVCGRKGFEKFLQKQYLEYVLREQNEHGGYGLKGNIWKKLAEKQRNKREDYSMKYGTHSHATGLAVEVLGLFIRWLLKETFYNQ